MTVGGVDPSAGSGTTGSSGMSCQGGSRIGREVAMEAELIRGVEKRERRGVESKGAVTSGLGLDMVHSRLHHVSIFWDSMVATVPF